MENSLNGKLNPKLRKSIFVTLEGGEACGKTTQFELLKEYINEKYPNKGVFVHEPGGTILGEKIRNLLLNDESIQMSPMAELLLFEASRAELYEKVIKPALNEEKIIVANRYYDSSIAYQGSARNIMDKDEILKFNRQILNNLIPDLTIYLKMPPEEAFLRKGTAKLDKLEQTGIEFHKKVADGFDYIASKEPNRIYIIDARQSIEQIHSQIVSKVEEIISSKGQEDKI